MPHIPTTHHRLSDSRQLLGEENRSNMDVYMSFSRRLPMPSPAYAVACPCRRLPMPSPAHAVARLCRHVGRLLRHEKAGENLVKTELGSAGYFFFLAGAWPFGDFGSCNMKSIMPCCGNAK
jgi:hypothetical protein